MHNSKHIGAGGGRWNNILYQSSKDSAVNLAFPLIYYSVKEKERKNGGGHSSEHIERTRAELLFFSILATG